VRQELGLLRDITGKDASSAPGVRPLELFMCSIVRRSGYREGIKWLCVTPVSNLRTRPAAARRTNGRSRRPGADGPRRLSRTPLGSSQHIK